MSVIGIFATLLFGIAAGILTSEIQPIWLRRIAGMGIGGAAGAAIMLGSHWLGLP